MKPVLVLAAALWLTAGCATIDYVGDSYQPSGHVDIYFSETDIPKEYRVIGQVDARGDQYISASKLQRKMLERAREVGADAVIIQDVSREPVSSTKSYDETTTVSKDEDGKTVTKSGTESGPPVGNRIRAVFVRYR